MSSFKIFKDKIQPFIFGLMLGLLVGIGFFIFKLDNYFKELNLYKKLNKNIEILSSNNSIEAEQGKPEKQKTKTSKESRSIKLTTINDSLAITEESVFSEEKRGSELKDSLKNDTLELVNESEDIVVRKDELLFAKDIEIINQNAVRSDNNIQNTKDSLLQQVSGIRDEHQKSSYYKVEFWKSPINYRGYKMAKNKIVVYGINPSDFLKLYKLDNVIYLKSLHATYRLDYSNDFRQFEKITDEDILSRLK